MNVLYKEDSYREWYAYRLEELDDVSQMKSREFILY
jgi:hypothetical protein